MKTLKELIAEKLPVGALVKFYNHTYQFVLNGTTPLFQDLDSFTGYKVSPTLDEIGWQPTTAYDAQIDPKTLPIPEPFWTGWVVWDGYKFQPIDYGDNGSGLFEDEYHMQYIKSDSQPCLPPA